jgi:hypothetical protein
MWNMDDGHHDDISLFVYDVYGYTSTHSESEELEMDHDSPLLPLPPSPSMTALHRANVLSVADSASSTESVYGEEI